MTHPARLSAAFDPPLPQDAAARLLVHPRFAARIEAMCGPTDHTRDGLEALARRAGPILHARAFVREIRGPAIADLTARFGADALADARAHADLGWNRDAPIDTLAADGIACLGAWIAALPEPERRGVSMLWPDDDAVPCTTDATILTLGPRIITRLMDVK